MSNGAVSAQAGSGGDPKAGDRPAEEGLNVVALLLAAVGGGIGVLGFVAFFGASILWARMDEAGLPGNDAVAVIPKSVLIATGASFLAPAMLVALGFTALLYLVETATLTWKTASLRKLERDARDLEDGARQEEEEAARIRERADQAHQRSLDAIREFETAEAGSGASESLRGVAEAAQKKSWEAEQSRLGAADADRAAATKRREAEQLQEEHMESIESLRIILRIGLVAGVFLVGFVLTLTVVSVGLPLERIFVLVLLLVALAVICLGVLTGTGSFAWFALTAFIAVGLVCGFVTYYRTVDNPKVEPAALLRTGAGPLYGFFVAQSSDRIYIGITEADGLPQLDAIPRDEVTDLAIGALEESKDARAEARQMALDLCLLGNRRAKRLENGSRAILTPPALPKTRPCDSTDFQELKGQPGQTSS
jgi:hypothetical protein